MKKTLSAVAASALFSVAGLAGAAEPVQLTEGQMDNVSAGAISIAGGNAFALIGTALSTSTSGTNVTVTPVSLSLSTNASNFSLASGFVAVAESQAAAEL